MYRRTFITPSLVLPSILASRCSVSQSTASKSDGLKLSLSQWALHREQFGKSKENYAQWQKWLETDAETLITPRQKFGAEKTGTTVTSG